MGVTAGGEGGGERAGGRSKGGTSFPVAVTSANRRHQAWISAWLARTRFLTNIFFLRNNFFGRAKSRNERVTFTLQGDSSDGVGYIVSPYSVFPVRICPPPRYIVYPT